MEYLPEGDGAGLAIDQSEHIDGIGGLERSELEELTFDGADLAGALEFDDDPQPIAVGFVTEVGDALDAALADELSDPLDQRGLVGLVRQGNEGELRRVGEGLSK